MSFNPSEYYMPGIALLLFMRKKSTAQSGQDVHPEMVRGSTGLWNVSDYI